MLPEGATNEAYFTDEGGSVPKWGAPIPDMISTTIYREGRNGEVIRENGRTHRASRELEDFDTRMKKELYREECEHGSRFNVPGFSKNQLQKVWGRL